VKRASLRTREATRVRFAPTPASAPLYSNPPRVGEEGYVTKVSVPGKGRTTSISGPGGGLLYVMWDRSGTQGVSPMDLFVIPKGKPCWGCGESTTSSALGKPFCESCMARRNPSRARVRAIGEVPRSRTEVSREKREAHLAKRVEALVISVGGKRFFSPGYPLEVETKYGTLGISAPHGWIATRFEDAARGQRAGAGLTGKWNFFPRGESIKAYDELFETFAASLRRIL